MSSGYVPILKIL